MLKDEAESRIKKWIARLVAKRPRADGEEPIEFSKDHLRKIREAAYEESRALGLPDKEAGLVADAMVGRLAIAS